MDKDRLVSIETIGAQFDVSVGTVHTIIREELKTQSICVKFVLRVLREDQKERWCHDSREMIGLINSDPAVLDALVTCDESWIYCYDPRDRVPSGCMLALPDPRRPDRANPPTKLWWSLFLTALSWSTSTGFPLDRQSTRNKYYVEVLREFRKGFPRRGHHLSNRVSGISTRTKHLSTTPCLSQTIWTRWVSRQLFTLPLVHTLLPVTFGYSSRKGAVVMRKLRRWKRLWRRSLIRSHRTPMGTSRSLERHNKCIATGGDYFEGD